MGILSGGFMRVADYIVDFLVSHGINHCFLLSGGGSIFLDDAITCNSNMTFTGVRNEATAPMMAAAYAKVNASIGAIFVTTGPGGTNAITGVAEAWVDSTPIIVISGQVERKNASRLSNAHGLRSFGTQELDIVELAKPITKYAAIVENVEEIRYHLEKAFYYAKSGRPGPVWLDIPLDVQAAEIDVDTLKGFPKEKIRWFAPQADVQVVCKRLECANKPLLIVGQGIRNSNAIEILKEFASKFNIPVVSSRLGQDILKYDFPWYCGHGGTQGTPATFKIMQEADFVLSIGSSLSPSFTGNGKAFNPSAYICAVDIEEAELKKNSTLLTQQIVCDAGVFLCSLINELKKRKSEELLEWDVWCRKLVQEKSFVYNTKPSSPINLYYFVHTLDMLADETCIFVSDAGSSYYSTGQCLSFNHARREITSGTFASMGLAIPLAIGAACADPSATILAITGDGSVETNIQELRTLAVGEYNVKLFIINNGGYLSIRNTQDSKFDGRYINSNQNEDHSVLDFSKVAQCFEIPYFCIQKCDEISDIYSAVNQFKGPALIEVFTDPKDKIYTCY